MSKDAAYRISAWLGFLGVALGAFGAHLLRARLAATGLAEIWEKGVFYHLLHAVVLVVLAGQSRTRWLAWWLMLGGVVVFSGSLYVLAFTGVLWLGAITPLGGLGLLGGWLVLALEGVGEQAGTRGAG